MSSDKDCFFISPIGENGSDTRKRSDKVLEYIINEVVSDFGYSVIRADQMDQPGSITNQVIRKTVDSDLVIADLTGYNPNVFYELAVRHATGKPYIQLIDSSESIPFDISDLRTVHYGLEVSEANGAKEEIRSQLESWEDEEPSFDNPISHSAEMQSLRESADPTDQNLADMLETMSNIDKKIDRMGSYLSKINHIQSPEYRNETENSASNMVRIGNENFFVDSYPVDDEAVAEMAAITGFSRAYVRKELEKHKMNMSRDDDGDLPPP